jgi:hypothetical protein
MSEIFNVPSSNLYFYKSVMMFQLRISSQYTTETEVSCKTHNWL